MSTSLARLVESLDKPEWRYTVRNDGVGWEITLWDRQRLVASTINPFISETHANLIGEAWVWSAVRGQIGDEGVQYCAE